MNNQFQIDAFILAGGKSSRMGTDKGLLLFNDKHLIEWSIEELQKIFSKIVIVSNKQVYKKFKLSVIKDIRKNLGPAGGIYSALKYTKADYIFVISCDMPLITSEAIHFLVSQLNSCDILVPLCQNKVQPLFALYSKNCFLKWKELIDKGETKLQVMIEQFNIKKVSVNNNPLFKAEQFININDRNDLSKAFQLINNES